MNGGTDLLSSTLPLKKMDRSPSGADVAVVKSRWRNYCWAPVEPLEAGREYRAAFTYTMTNECTRATTGGSVDWTFFTEGGATTTTTTPPTTTTAAPPTTTATIVPPPPLFADVDAGSPYRTAIERLAEKGIISGFEVADSGRVFGPQLQLSRQPFAKMIVWTLALEASPPGTCPFGDVGAGWPYPSGFVATAAVRGMVLGTSLDPPRFSPWAPVTRGQLVTMAVRAMRNLSPLVVAEPPLEYEGYAPSGDATHGSSVRVAEYNGVLEGVVGLGPRGDIRAAANRGETAQILWNLLRSVGGV